MGRIKKGYRQGVEILRGRTQLQVQAPHLDLHIGTASSVHSVEFPVWKHKLEFSPKL